MTAKTLFAIINKFSPKTSMRKMQLRNPQGHIASPIEEAALLKKHVMDTWRGPCTFPTAAHRFSGMPFTVEDLEKELSQIPVSKAVARPCAPAPVWRMLAVTLAPPLHALLTYWWDRPEPFIPSWFRDAWMLLIPKPHKPPTTPGALRPLALQEPISKCIVGLLTKGAMREAVSGFLPNAPMGLSPREIDSRGLAQSIQTLPFSQDIDCQLQIHTFYETTGNCQMSFSGGPTIVPRH